MRIAEHDMASSAVHQTFRTRFNLVGGHCILESARRVHREHSVSLHEVVIVRIDHSTRRKTIGDIQYVWKQYICHFIASDQNNFCF